MTTPLEDPAATVWLIEARPSFQHNGVGKTRMR